MLTNIFVESSFWIFDVLFLTQKHPARLMLMTLSLPLSLLITNE